MNAVAKLPVLERVEAFMREHTTSIEQRDVVAAFAGEPAEVVRLSLQALRKQGRLAASVEGGRVYYVWALGGAPRVPEAPPLRQAGSAAYIPMASGAHKVVEAMQRGKEDSYTFAEICSLSGIRPNVARSHLQLLVNQEKVYAQGQTTRRRYSLKPFEPETSAPESTIANRLLSFLKSIDRPLSTDELVDLTGGNAPIVKAHLAALGLQGAVHSEDVGGHLIWSRAEPPYPGDRPAPPAEEKAPACAIPSRERPPCLLPVVESPECDCAITAEGEIVILDGAALVRVPRRQVRAIARLIRRLDSAGLLDG